MRNRKVIIVFPLAGLVVLGMCWCGAAEPKPAAPRSAKSLVAPGAKIVKLPGEYRFTEGPAVDAKGNVFFSDIPTSRTYKWSVGGKMSLWREDTGGANGLFFDKKGNLLACEGNRERLTSITPKGKVTVLADKYKGKRFNKPNDLWIDPAGGVYFTDPVYGRYKVTQGGEHVYYLSPGGKVVTRVINDMTRPNGVVGTPDGKILYVADHGAGRVYRYKINTLDLPDTSKMLAFLSSDTKLIAIRVQGEDRSKGDPPYVVAGQRVNLVQLRRIMKLAVKINSNRQVLISGDKLALHITIANAVHILDGGVVEANIRFDYGPTVNLTEHSKMSAFLRSGAKLIGIDVRGEDRSKGDPPYMVSGRRVNLLQLRKIIKDAVKDNANPKVFIRSNGNALHGTVANAVAACRDGGVVKTSIGCDYVPRINLPDTIKKPALLSSATRLMIVHVRGEDYSQKDPPYVVSGRRVKLLQLRKIIKDAVKNNANQRVLIRGDKNALHGTVASAVAACCDGGVVKANIRYDYVRMANDPRLHDKRLYDKTLFATVRCDGMTVDDEGNLYLTESAVIVYSPAGKEIERIKVPERPANVCFGGADLGTLFVTARKSVYTVKMRVKGVRPKSK